MTRTIDNLDQLITKLHNGGRLRVWSIIVTVFGDMIMPRGGTVGLSTLQTITDRLAIEPGALRTAMSRLTKDGWVSRSRHGRNSFYHLTPNGIAEIDAASTRIYAGAPRPAGERWLLFLGEGRSGAERLRLDERMDQLGFISLQHGAYLWTDIRAAPSIDAGEFMVMAGEVRAVPVWLQTQMGPADLAEGYRQLMTDFTGLADGLAAGEALSPLDAMAARCLLVHGWRRLILRQIDGPIELFPSDWPGEITRRFVGDLYAQLIPASEAWLEGQAMWPTGTLPSVEPRLEGRFR